MRLTFLGTGTSFGVPVIGCQCAVCTSVDPHDRRTRHAALLEDDEGSHRLLVDAPPELRLQLVAARVRDIDAVWFTHCHADHVHGIDDLRAFSARQGRPVAAFADEACAATLRERFDYIFGPDLPPVAGVTRPDIQLRVVRPDQPIDVAGFRLLPLAVPHGDQRCLAFRVGELGYVTDAKDLPPDVRAALAGVRVLVLNALWFGDPHPTHLTIEQAVGIGQEIGAERTYLTHLSHRQSHTEILAALPPGFEPAYDGLVVEL